MLEPAKRGEGNAPRVPRRRGPVRSPGSQGELPVPRSRPPALRAREARPPRAGKSRRPLIRSKVTFPVCARLTPARPGLEQRVRDDPGRVEYTPGEEIREGAAAQEPESLPQSLPGLPPGAIPTGSCIFTIDDSHRPPPLYVQELEPVVRCPASSRYLGSFDMTRQPSVYRTWFW